MKAICRLGLACGAVILLAGCGVLGDFGIGWNARGEDRTGGGPSKVAGGSAPALSTREVIVFFTEAEPYFGMPSSEESVRANAHLISAVVGFWHQIERHRYDRLVPFGATTPEVIRDTVALARASGALPVGLFHNLLYGRTSWSKEVIAKLLTDEAAQRELIEDVAAQARAWQFGGVNIDIEHVEPAFRDAFTRFVSHLAERLHRDGVEVSIAVPAKTWDNPRDGWSGGFDYRAIGEAVDRVILMTYDEHGYSSGPGPIASSGWVDSVVRYAVTQVPPHKVIVGLAGYGFDWPASGRPRYISYEGAVALARRYGVPIHWDDEAHAPYFIYYENGERHEVWFENASSLSWKLDLVERYDLGGVALWRGGLEDPELWSVMAQKFEAAKY